MTWLPSVQDVADLMPTRFGESGPDDYTIPSADQLDRLIGRRAVEVRADCGRVDDVDDQAIVDLATETVALGTAAYVASQFFPEQQDNSEEQQFLRRRYEEHRHLLRRQILMWWRANRDEVP